MRQAICHADKTLYALTAPQLAALTAFLETLSAGLTDTALIDLTLRRDETKALWLGMTFEQAVDETELLDKLTAGEVTLPRRKTP